ncbi:MAG: endopeptidase La [Phycisphaerae bacterium]|jgi:ATP-dependent Lon protease
MNPAEASKSRIVDHDEPEIVISPSQGSKVQADGEEVTIPSEAGILPVRNIVLFPGTVLPLDIGRAKSRRLIDAVLPQEKIIMAVCQKSPDVEDPGPDDLYTVGAATVILKLLKLEEGSRIIVHGVARARIDEFITREPYLRAKITVLQETVEQGTEMEALVMNARNIARRILKLSPNIPEEAGMVLSSIDAPGTLADFLASNLPLDLTTKQMLLSELHVEQRLRMVITELQHQLDVLELSNKIQEQVRASIDKTQREYFLQEQLKAIQKELGQTDEKTAEIAQIRKKIETIGMPESVKTEAIRELGRLEAIPSVSPEYNIVRTYLDVMTELPWAKSTQDKLDVEAASRILNRDHYDLEKVKRRILEYLAVRKLAPAARGAILCFVGPPGVGKTSLGQSIASALGRKFIRMSLGGMRDEAELRGHRRTYIGAMPGRIIQEIRKAGTNNPVFMLDELDKVGADFRGDPTSALLEVLDPAQNNSFQDHYLNVPFDLSKVMFIGTANVMATVSPPLRDRMEVIEIPGYTQAEKLHIATKYLVARQLTENGLTSGHVKWKKEALVRLIESYTREAGVRELERQIGSVCRAEAAQIARGKVKSCTITPAVVEEVLGPVKYESELALRTSVPGVATGLAYTPSGGEIIFIEATAYPGKGGLTLTGQIGEVMKESAQAAFSLLKSRLGEMKMESDKLAQTDIHVHVPAGAIPKDGPSAGVAMFTALTSLLMGRPLRPDLAMTGEITLRGLVLPIGGVKEKVLAAKRAGITTIVLPSRNRKDLVDVPADARKGLKFRFVDHVDQVLDIVFAPQRAGNSAKAPAAKTRRPKAPGRKDRPARTA